MLALFDIAGEHSKISNNLENEPGTQQEVFLRQYIQNNPKSKLLRTHKVSKKAKGNPGEVQYYSARAKEMYIRDNEGNLYYRVQEFEGEELKLAAYVLGRSGRLLAKEPIKVKDGRGVAECSIEAAPQRLLVKIGPDIKDLKGLSRHKPISQSVEVIAGKKAELELEILKPGWIC